ncbi:hypothetical protein [Pelagimonas varians]|uniref:Uncharacterized protein n=1 Tax=Pelagimonas varians TaxID=696760 RepID=A0A238KF35_9RHOB|nr:hypothetical protein [Pelagimonas varians]PYG32397.1 hypothetical protein C8N36_103146 [Pelagimonas varians]SMX41463.1 hypothetical protein PEV8663_02283 [Pelagimonas varians]
MRNPPLLKFLAAVQMHCETAATLMRASELEPLDLQLSVAIAEDLGFVENTGEIHPSLRITADGWAWVTQELAPFRGLIRDAARTGGVS